MAHGIIGAARRGARALRSVGPATVAVAIALIIGAAGFADAATGGAFILGRANTESSTAVVTDSTGVPLALDAPSGKSPLSVNSSVQVHRLNAQYVGGDSAAKLNSAGGIGMTAANVNIALPTDALVDVASTGPLPKGTYYISASALVYAGGSSTVYCVVVDAPLNWGGGASPNYLQASETTVVTVAAGAKVTEACYGEGTGQSVYNAAITAVRVNASSAGTAASALPPGFPGRVALSRRAIAGGPPKS